MTYYYASCYDQRSSKGKLMRLITSAVVALTAATVPVQADIVASKIAGWANAYGDATLVSSKNVASTDHLSTGLYRIRFKSDITGCAFMGTAEMGQSQIAVWHSSLDTAREVRVYTSYNQQSY